MWIIWSPIITWKFSPQAVLQWSCKGKNKIWLAMLSSLLILISHSPVEESIHVIKKNAWFKNWIVTGLIRHQSSKWQSGKEKSIYEVTLQTLKILFTCTVTLTCRAWPTVPKTEMNNPRFEWNLETNNELNIKIIKFTLFSSQGCLTR